MEKVRSILSLSLSPSFLVSRLSIRVSLASFSSLVSFPRFVDALYLSLSLSPSLPLSTPFSIAASLSPPPPPPPPPPSSGFSSYALRAPPPCPPSSTPASQRGRRRSLFEAALFFFPAPSVHSPLPLAPPPPPILVPVPSDAVCQSAEGRHPPAENSSKNIHSTTGGRYVDACNRAEPFGGRLESTESRREGGGGRYIYVPGTDNDANFLSALFAKWNGD